MNPTAALHMANGKKIIIELLPEFAPNTVNSFIYVASRGLMDHHAIQRIVPGNWVDVTYTSFGKKEAQYLIPNEFTLNPGIEPLDSHPGMVGMNYIYDTTLLLKIDKEYANVLGYVKLKEYDPMTNSLYRNRKQIYNEKYNVIKGK